MANGVAILRHRCLRPDSRTSAAAPAIHSAGRNTIVADARGNRENRWTNRRLNTVEPNTVEAVLDNFFSAMASATRAVPTAPCRSAPARSHGQFNRLNSTHSLLQILTRGISPGEKSRGGDKPFARSKPQFPGGCRTEFPVAESHWPLAGWLPRPKNRHHN